MQLQFPVHLLPLTFIFPDGNRVNIDAERSIEAGKLVIACGCCVPPNRCEHIDEIDAQLKAGRPIPPNVNKIFNKLGYSLAKDGQEYSLSSTFMEIRTPCCGHQQRIYIGSNQDTCKQCKQRFVI